MAGVEGPGGNVPVYEPKKFTGPNALEKAQAFAAKDKGDELIVKQKDGSVLVYDLDDKNQVETAKKATADLDPSQIDFAVNLDTDKAQIAADKAAFAGYGSKYISKEDMDVTAKALGVDRNSFPEGPQGDKEYLMAVQRAANSWLLRQPGFDPNDLCKVDGVPKEQTFGTLKKVAEGKLKEAKAIEDQFSARKAEYEAALAAYKKDPTEANATVLKEKRTAFDKAFDTYAPIFNDTNLNAIGVIYKVDKKVGPQMDSIGRPPSEAELFKDLPKVKPKVSDADKEVDTAISAQKAKEVREANKAAYERVYKELDGATGDGAEKKIIGEVIKAKAEGRGIEFLKYEYSNGHASESDRKKPEYANDLMWMIEDVDDGNRHTLLGALLTTNGIEKEPQMVSDILHHPRIEKGHLTALAKRADLAPEVKMAIYRRMLEMGMGDSVEAKNLVTGLISEPGGAQKLIAAGVPVDKLFEATKGQSGPRASLEKGLEEGMKSKDPKERRLAFSGMKTFVLMKAQEDPQGTLALLKSDSKATPYAKAIALEWAVKTDRLPEGKASKVVADLALSLPIGILKYTFDTTGPNAEVGYLMRRMSPEDLDKFKERMLETLKTSKDPETIAWCTRCLALSFNGDDAKLGKYLTEKKVDPEVRIRMAASYSTIQGTDKQWLTAEGRYEDLVKGMDPPLPKDKVREVLSSMGLPDHVVGKLVAYTPIAEVPPTK